MFDLIDFRKTVDSFYQAIQQVNGEITGVKPSEDKWSLKEIVGHLIDSASNNHQRFVRLQIDDLLGFPPYEAEQWIKIQGYNTMEWNEIKGLWYSYNIMLLRVIENINPGTLKNVWVKGEDAITLEHMVNDYYRHMRWHFEQFETRLKEIEK